jgi:aminoglycoside/choline kinase family phosphotransferase
VIRVQIEPLVARASYNAQLARLRLAYDVQTAEAPRSLIAKLPAGEGPDADADRHENAAVFQPGQKECWFYRRVAANVPGPPVNVPRCYFNALDAATGESFLLLQDLAPARTGSWANGASVQEADLALRSIARLHAAWWQVEPAAEPELARLVGNLQEEQELVERLYQQAWPQFLGRTPVEVPDDVRQFGERLVGRIAAADALLDDSPHTLVHGDFRLENILYGTCDGQPACWVIDWEDVSLGSGMLDVAWFLGGCLRVEDSAEEGWLLRRYHRALIHEGVAGYPWAQCRRDYTCAMISCFVQGILSALPPETGDKYSHSLARALEERFVAACTRLRLHELLPS